MKRLHDIDDDENAVGMTAMIDVTFLLLIFFLCTLSFRTLEGKLAAHLPKDVGVHPGTDAPIEAIAVRITLLSPGDLASDAPVSERPGRLLAWRVGPRTVDGPEGLRTRLAELHALDPERPVKLDVGAGVVHGEAVGALDACLAAGLDDVTFVGAER